MRIDESKVSVPARPISFGDRFFTLRMSESQLESTKQLPAQVLDAPESSRLAADWQSEAMQLAQAPYVIAANRGLGNFGSLGGKTIKSISTLVSQEVFDKDSDTSRFVAAAAEAFSVLDGIATGLNSVPFVGAALGVTLSIVRAVISKTRASTPLPPPLQMDPVNDQENVNAALQVVRAESDWTRLFLPADGGPGGDELGGWIYFKDQNGWNTFQRGPDRTTPNFGCAPGDLFFVAKGAQSRVGTGNVTIPNDSPTPPHSLILRKGNNPAALHDLVFSLSDWYPGLAALGRSVWSMIGTADTAAMFNVDGYRVIGGWTDYHNSLERFRDYMDGFLGMDLPAGSKGFKRQVIAEYLGSVGVAFHDARTADGRPLTREQLLELALDANRRPLGETVGLQASRAASNLVMRQYGAAETRLNALVSKDAPALRDKGLREHFMRERTRQLDAGRFDDVDLDEVPDQQLRQRILARLRTSGGSRGQGLSGPNKFADPVSIAREREFWDEVKQKVPRPPGMTGLGVPYEPDEKGGGSVLAATLLAAAGIGGTALYLHNRKRSRKPRKET